MFKIREILFLLTIFSCCHAVGQDDFILRNNTLDEQKIILLFQSRVLLKSNESILAPAGFSFVIHGGEKNIFHQSCSS